VQQSPAEAEGYLALQRQILANIGIGILFRSNIVGKKFICVSKHLSDSCWTCQSVAAARAVRQESLCFFMCVLCTASVRIQITDENRGKGQEETDGTGRSV